MFLAGNSQRGPIYWEFWGFCVPKCILVLLPYQRHSYARLGCLSYYACKYVECASIQERKKEQGQVKLAKVYFTYLGSPPVNQFQPVLAHLIIS